MLRKKWTVFLGTVLLVMFFATAAAYAEEEFLKQGASGDEVLWLQTKLQAHGYYYGELDGKFGPITHRAVVRLQWDCGLPADGVVGLDTIKALVDFDPEAVLASRGAIEDRRGQAIVAFAEQFLGTPYTWAGTSSRGFDCSGFTYYVFGEFGVGLPHRADLQFREGYPVSELSVGDLVFYSTYESGPSHVGIYMGGNEFIHASSGAGEVCITSMSAAYYSARYLGARRVL